MKISVILLRYRETRILKNLKFYFAGNFYDFSFKNYLKNGADFSGNQLTGVPSISVQNLINFELLRNLKLDVAHFYTSEIPLNDANSVFYRIAQLAKESATGQTMDYDYILKTVRSTIDVVCFFERTYMTELYFDPVAKYLAQSGQ